MPFIPHTQADLQAMLDVLNIDTVQALYDEVPRSLPQADLEHIPPGMTELLVTRLMQEREPPVFPGSCFIGAGAYEHHTPAAVVDIVSRGEFYTAYTPYQAEASQGNLQLIYEFQTILTQLTGMDVSNASLYDGASSVAEAVLMAIRIKRNQAKRVIVPTTINPNYRAVLQALLEPQGIVLESLPYATDTGSIAIAALADVNQDGLAAVIIPQPNFFGRLELADELTDKAHELGALVIALVNPSALALIKEPGKWGQTGADIVCGEGQSLGLPLMSGGPYFGILACKKEFVRQMPGRIVGKTEDAKGRVGYTLTLQAREQHIRRAKATSNICTNQGLMVTMSTIYMTLLGAEGLRAVAAASHDNARALKERLIAIEGVSAVFEGPFYHEFVLKFNKPVERVLEQLNDVGLQGGYALKADYPELGNCLLVCATETKTAHDLERYQHLLTKVMS